MNGTTLRGTTRKVYYAILQFINEHAYLPSLPDLCESTGYAMGQIQYHIGKLGENNLVRWEKGLTRTLRPVDMVIDLTACFQKLQAVEADPDPAPQAAD